MSAIRPTPKNLSHNQKPPPPQLHHQTTPNQWSSPIPTWTPRHPRLWVGKNHPHKVRCCPELVHPLPLRSGLSIPKLLAAPLSTRDRVKMVPKHLIPPHNKHKSCKKGGASSRNLNKALPRPRTTFGRKMQRSRSRRTGKLLHSHNQAYPNPLLRRPTKPINGPTLPLCRVCRPCPRSWRWKKTYACVNCST